MGSLPYYSWYPSDFKSSTSHFTFDERAIYRELLDWSWLNGPLPEDDRRLASIAGCTLKRWRAASVQVLSKFSANGEGLVNGRLESIRLKTKEKCAARAEAGRAGGLAKAKQLPSKSVAKGVAKPKHPKSEPKPDPPNGGVPPVSPPFEGEEFKAALAGYLEHRRTIRKKITQRGLELLFGRLARVPESTAVEALNRSVENGWTGCDPGWLTDPRSAPAADRKTAGKTRSYDNVAVDA